MNQLTGWVTPGIAAAAGRLRSDRFTSAFAWICRLALAAAFLPAGLKKVVNEPFTLLPPESGVVGYFFDALYQTGFYYQFLGWAQILAALGLFVPRIRLIAALVFAAILVNIVVLTWSVGFRGTRWIAVFMLAANTYLLLFDFDRLAGLWAAPGKPASATSDEISPG